MSRQDTMVLMVLTGLTEEDRAHIGRDQTIIQNCGNRFCFAKDAHVEEHTHSCVSAKMD